MAADDKPGKAPSQSGLPPKPARSRARSPEPLPPWKPEWSTGKWVEDDPRHFLMSDRKRPARCPYCGTKSHVLPNAKGIRMYPECAPTTGDPVYTY